MFRPFPILLVSLALTACVKMAKKAQAPTKLPTLMGSEWAPETENGSEQFVAFKSGGEVIGHGGCNKFFGSYALSGDTLMIGPLASTKMACKGKMQAEASFLKTLQSVRTIEASHFHLILKGEDDTKLMTLRRRDWD